MKKFFYLTILLMSIGLASRANPGDTTWVQANSRNIEHDASNTDWYGNYDTAVTFPSGNTTYRRIYMIFTLGKYQCAGYNYACNNCSNSIAWCADWDYTIQNYVMTPDGDTVELGRLITPYANAGGSLPNMPYTWTKKYVYDVTDYASLLKGQAGMRLFYSGYSGGFTGDIKFAFIEGTPDRTVTGIVPLWNGSYSYGNTADPINSHFQTVNETAPAGTQSASIKFTVTGHGSDSINYCCEFMSHNYQVMENSNQVDQYTIWRPNCGANELYPQSGTWIYQRGNWCPGAIVYTNTHNLQNITAGTNFTTDIVFDPYTSPSNYSPDNFEFGSYTTYATLIYYGGFNKTLDASLDEIIAPNIDNDYFRENPAGKPTVHVKNTGSTIITSMQFQYGVQGTSLANYTWQGSLQPLHDTDIVLPEQWSMRELSGTTGNSTFTAQITQVNGQTDDDATNNAMTSTFTPTPKWPTSIIVSMKTNNEGNNGICETSWQILDFNDSVVAERVNAAYNTTYNDTVNLGVAPYRLVVTDGGCDGLNWWGFSQEGITAGAISVHKVAIPATILPLNGDNVSTYPNDFGCGFTQYFTANSFGLDVNEVSNSQQGIEAYPNPAQNNVTVNINGFHQVNGTLQVIDILGRTVIQKQCSNSAESLNVSKLSNGVYTIVYFDKSTPDNKLQTRLLIAK